jgi:hypothetical protein
MSRRRSARTPGREGWRGSSVARWSAGLAVVAILIAAPVAVFRSQAGSSRLRSGSLAGLTHAAAPTGWNRFDVPVPDGAATLGIPPRFAPFAGDRGTASAAVRDATGRIRAYLNVTPREGDERLRGFAALRVHLLAGEHDESVHLEAASEDVAFGGGGHQSCVLDDYVTRIGHHHYRELACFAVGRRGSAAVVVAAATVADWAHFEPQLRRAVASFTVS